MRAALVLAIAGAAAWGMSEVYRRMSIDGREASVERS
jgi:hypothetical protein